MQANVTNDVRSLTQHGSQVVHHGLDIVIVGHTHKEPQANNIIFSPELLWDRLENVKL